MATIPAGEEGHELFLQAAGWWSDHHPEAFQGTPFPDKLERKIYDETENPDPPPGLLREDVTPSQAVLEAALDSALAAIAIEEAREEARLLLVQAKEYIRTQLESTSPSTAQQQVAILLPYVSGVNANAFLTSRMTKLIGLANTAYGWSLVINPAASPNYQRWLEVFIQMVSIET